MADLCYKNLVESKTLRQPGKLRGTRLVVRQSLIDYIESCPANVCDVQKKKPSLAQTKNGFNTDEANIVDVLTGTSKPQITTSHCNLKLKGALRHG